MQIKVYNSSEIGQLALVKKEDLRKYYSRNSVLLGTNKPQNFIVVNNINPLNDVKMDFDGTEKHQRTLS